MSTPDPPHDPSIDEDPRDASEVSAEDAADTDSAPSGFMTPDQLRAELEEANQRVLRSHAELENYRRRMRREIDEGQRFASQSLLTDLLPVLDNIRRGIESAENTDPDSALLEGVRMVEQQLEDVLVKNNCPRIPAEGQEFDPALHEAIAQLPSEEVPSGKVLQVALQGYRLHDRVIRPAQVVVSSGSPSQGA